MSRSVSPSVRRAVRDVLDAWTSYNPDGSMAEWEIVDKSISRLVVTTFGDRTMEDKQEDGAGAGLDLVSLLGRVALIAVVTVVVLAVAATVIWVGWGRP